MTPPNLIVCNVSAGTTSQIKATNKNIYVNRKVLISNGKETFTVSPDDKAIAHCNDENQMNKNHMGLNWAEYEFFEKLCSADGVSDSLTMDDIKNAGKKKLMNAKFEFVGDFEKTGQVNISYEVKNGSTKVLNLDFETDAEIAQARVQTQAAKKQDSKKETETKQEPSIFTKIAICIAKFMDEYNLHW